MTTSTGGGEPGCTTLAFEPLPESAIEWSGFPACDPQSGICIVYPAPMEHVGPVAMSPSGTAYAASNNTIASWKDGTGVVHRLPTKMAISSITAVSDSDVWAVGEGSLLAHFDGSIWTVSELPEPSALYGVWASGPNDVWTVGNFGAIGHYSGTWSAITLPDDPSLFAVHGTGPLDVWAVGSHSGIDGAVYHFDGMQWLEVPVDANEWLESVYAATPSDVWIAGRNGVVLRGNASGFVPVTIPVATSESQSFSSVWGTGPNDVWLLGDTDTLHFDGSTWTRLEPIGFTIAGRSATDIVAGAYTAANHWDGTVWKEDFGLSEPPLAQAWAAAPDDVWFVGGEGAVVRTDGEDIRRGKLGDRSLTAIWGSGPTDVWITDGDRVLRGDGETFCEVAVPATDSFGSYLTIAGSGPNDVWLLQSDAPPLHFDGSSWTPVGEDLNALSIVAFSPTEAWASGDNLLHWDGTTWDYPETDFSPANGRDESFGLLWGSGPTDLWVVRDVFLESPKFAHWDGSVFTEIDSVANSSGTLSGSAPNDVWSFGFDVLHYDGQTWADVPSGRLRVNASVATTEDVWAVGDHGLILRRSNSLGPP